MTPRKDPHAAAMGRKGGAANTPAQLAARRKNAVRGGRTPLYRFAHQGTATKGTIAIERREGDHWLPCARLTPYVLIALGRWLRATLPRTTVDSFDGGTATYRRE